MSGIASATGLICARIQPVRRPKRERVELSGYSKPAPFGLRPFAGLFNPYPYGCSVLCNHPADCEVKDILRRAKDSWPTEGTGFLSKDVQIIRTNFLPVVGSETIRTHVITCAGRSSRMTRVTIEATPLPEELFRKYTETDSRPPTPSPTPASLHPRSGNNQDENYPHEDHRSPLALSKAKERTALILDLRTASFNQENDTLTWHALTLEPAPTPRKSEISSYKLIPRQTLTTPKPRKQITVPTSPVDVQISQADSSKILSYDEEDSDSEEEPEVILRRRGKRLRKRKRRRGSTYGQQTEVRDPFEPPETQVSQIEDASRRASKQESARETVEVEGERGTDPSPDTSMPSSFIAPDILKHLCRELDRDKVEAEFSIKRRIAYEEALRVKEMIGHSASRSTRQTLMNLPQSIPRLFSRQAARFELLDSRSLSGLTPLEYLKRYVNVSRGRKVIFARTFNKFVAESEYGKRFMLATDVREAIQELIGESLSEEQQERFEKLIGEIREPVDFRTWCGIAAITERLLCPLPQREIDPPAWLERADFEMLNRKLGSIDMNPNLTLLLTEIRDR